MNLYHRQSPVSPVIVLAALGLAVMLVASNVMVTTAGPAPIERNWVFGKLDRTTSYSQTFVADRPGLTAVRVLLFPPAVASSDLITLRLRYADDIAPDLAVVSLPVSALARNGMTTFSFVPLRTRESPYVVTTTLRLTLEAPALEPAAGVTVIAGPDTYAGGRLSVNGKRHAFADLAFQPVFQQPLINSLLPVVRLADGKPGLLGWPPFYAMIVYIYLCGLLGVLWMLWRHMRRSVDAA